MRDQIFKKKSKAKKMNMKKKSSNAKSSKLQSPITKIPLIRLDRFRKGSGQHPTKLVDSTRLKNRFKGPSCSSS